MGFKLKWRDHHLELDKRTHVMGVLNVTPDSFSDGGLYLEPEKAVAHGLEMVRNGADIIDIGGESTRPYARRVSTEEEKDRVLPVIEALAKEVRIPISIDTYKSEVAGDAIKSGASMINDISALRFDPEMGAIAAREEVPVIMMHMKGDPSNMQDNPSYENLIPEILDFLEDAIERAKSFGIPRDLIIVDPGIGFGKVFDDNLKIIKELGRFASLGCPIMLGTSNKAFIGRILNKEPFERDTGTMATIAAASMNGAHIIRAHNVEKAVETVKIIDAIKMGKANPN
jgi:dihydropteroate synthase